MPSRLPFAIKDCPNSPKQIAAALLDSDGKCIQERLEVSMYSLGSWYIYRTLHIRGQECIVVMDRGGIFEGSIIMGFTSRVWFGHEQGFSQRAVARRVPWTMRQGT